MQAEDTTRYDSEVCGYLCFDHADLVEKISTWPADLFNYTTEYPMMLQCCMNQVPTSIDGSNYQDWYDQLCTASGNTGNSSSCDTYMEENWCVVEDGETKISSTKVECSCFADYDFGTSLDPNNTTSVLLELLNLVENDIDYSDVQSLICFSSQCSESGYKTDTMDSEKCPDLCANIVNIVNTGDYSIQDVDNIDQTISCSGDVYTIDTSDELEPEAEADSNSSDSIVWVFIALISGLVLFFAGLLLYHFITK
jgi:hypothetical protein